MMIRVHPPRAMRKKIREEYQRNGKSDVVYFTQATHHPLDVFALWAGSPLVFQSKAGIWPR